MLGKKPLFALLALACCVGVIYEIYFPITLFTKTLDDIPRPSCIDMSKDKARISVKDGEGILVGVYLTERKGYAKFTSKVLRTYHDVPDSDIRVYSTFDYDRNTLHSWYGRRAEIMKVGSKAAVVQELIELFVKSRYKVLFFIDDEMIFLSSWREFITQHMITNSIPFVSLYHSATLHNPNIDCDHFNRDLCKGNISGITGVAINKELATRLSKRHSDIISATNWNILLRNMKYAGFYPQKSLIMRIGQSDQDENFCGENEVPYGFKLCELPCWIRDGIQFYFDLCTDPQEIYHPDSSILHAHIKKRRWIRPVIAYSFYGNNPRYVEGAMENARRIFTIYPGYKIWMYLDYSVVPDVVQNLCSYNVKFINMTGSQISNQMSWRFLIAAEPVKWFTILDVDYRLLKRGKEATDDWLKSGRNFHVMRDHPNHSKVPINGQMWGGYGGLIPNMKRLIVDFNGWNFYMFDIYFLSRKIWPIIKNSVWVHDAYSIHKFGEDHPFPTKRKGSEYIGSVDFGGD